MPTLKNDASSPECLARTSRCDELVCWLEHIPTYLSCLQVQGPKLPPGVVRSLLANAWVFYARDGCLVRTDLGSTLVKAASEDDLGE
jgi:hypothetical protein